MNNVNPMEIVLSVVDHEYPNDIRVEEITKNRDLLKAAIKLAEKNGLYYYFIHRLKELRMDLPLSEKDRWKEENQKLSEFKKTIMLLNSISNDHGIDYIIIKACNTIPHVPKDVDIFVRKKDRIKLINALEDNGMKCVQSGISETALNGREYMRVDVYTEICYIGVDFMDNSFLWQSKITDEVFGIEYFGMNNEASFLLMLVHSLFGHRSMSLLDFLHIKSLRKDIDIGACKEYAHEKGWGFAFDLVLRKLNTLNEKIYKKGEVIDFPYLFNRNLILKCVSGIEGLTMSKYDKLFFHIALIQERISYELKDTPLYNLLKSFEPARNTINRLTASVKTIRGDRKSEDE